MPHSTASSSNAASISTQFSRDTVTSSSITKKNGSSKRSPARRQPIRIGSSNKICLEKILALGDSETSGSESSSESMHSDSTFAPSAPVRAQRKPKVSSPKTRGQQRKTERDKSPIAKRLRRGVTPSAKRASRTPSTNSSRKSTGSSNVSKKEPLEKGRALERSKTVARCPGRRVGESKEKVGVKDAGSNEKRGTSPSAMQGERSSQGKQTGANGTVAPFRKQRVRAVSVVPLASPRLPNKALSNPPSKPTVNPNSVVMSIKSGNPKILQPDVAVRPHNSNDGEASPLFIKGKGGNITKRTPAGVLFTCVHDGTSPRKQYNMVPSSNGDGTMGIPPPIAVSEGLSAAKSAVPVITTAKSSSSSTGSLISASSVRKGRARLETLDGVMGDETMPEPANDDPVLLLNPQQSSSITFQMLPIKKECPSPVIPPELHVPATALADLSFTSQDLDRSGSKLDTSKLDLLLKEKIGPSSILSLSPEPDSREEVPTRRTPRKPKSPQDRYSPDPLPLRRTGSLKSPGAIKRGRPNRDEIVVVKDPGGSDVPVNAHTPTGSGVDSSLWMENNDGSVMTNEDAATIGRANKSKKKVTAEENGEGAASVRLMNIPKKNRLKRKSDGSELSVNDTAGADVSVISPATTPTKARMKSLRNRKTIPSVALSIIPEVPVEIVTSHASEYDFQPASETASGESNSDTFVPNGNGKRTKRPKQKPQMAIVPITIKPELVSYFSEFHPLIPELSTRLAVDANMKDFSSIIPKTLAERNLISVLTSNDVLFTQSNVVSARWKSISESRLLVRRSLIYNTSHRRFSPPPSRLRRTTILKARNLECIIQQLIMRKTSVTARKTGNFNHPVDLEIALFSLAKHVASSSGHHNIFLKPDLSSLKENSVDIVADPMGRRQVQMQFGLLKGNPKEALVRDLLPPILEHCPKILGTMNGTSKVKFERSTVRLEGWNLNDYLVVNFESQQPLSKNFVKICAFNIGDIKEGLSLEVKDFYSMKIVVRRHVPQPTHQVDYQYVLIYGSGEHYQVREMCAIRNPYNCHACLLCGMRCDSLLVVLRHLDGLHPSVGYEYDPETQRLYLWFAPEHDFLRPNLPGLVDHWELLKFHKRMNGKSVPYPRDVFSSGNGSPSSSPLPPEVTHYADNRPVFQWISAKYIPPHLRLPDALPPFKVEHIHRIYGIPVVPTRSYLHTDAVQTSRPDMANINDYDSDEEAAAWQDQYEHEKIHDFIDCNPQEKQFMCLWNSFTRRLCPMFSLGIKDILCRFVVDHAIELELTEAYPALCAQLSILRRSNIITNAECLEVVRSYRSALRCQMDLRSRNILTSSLQGK